MRAVIDTNVLIAGLLWRSPSHKLLEHVRDGAFSMLSSPILLAELADVLTRPKFRTILARTRTSPAGSLEEIRRLVELIAPPPLPHPVCRDPDDDEALALAVAAKAHCVVSGDKDLLSLGEFQGIPIISPAEAVVRLG